MKLLVLVSLVTHIRLISYNVKYKVCNLVVDDADGLMHIKSGDYVCAICLCDYYVCVCSLET